MHVYGNILNTPPPQLFPPRNEKAHCTITTFVMWHRKILGLGKETYNIFPL